MRIKYNRYGILVFLLLGILTGCTGSPSMLTPYGEDAVLTASLTWLMFAIAGAVLLVISALLWMTYRRSRGAWDEKEFYTNDHKYLRNVLLGGGLLPLVVLMITMGLGIGVENATNVPNAKAASAIEIEVIGHQWWWEVHYSNQKFDTANEIHIPVGQPVTLRVTSADVIHSLWIPELHGKIDMIPGQTNTITLEADKAGTYRGQCAEYCGVQHAHMALFVIAESSTDFHAWLDDQNKSGVEPKVGSLEQTGEQVFLGSSCVYCHNIAGTNASGHVGPDLTHLASRVTIGSGLLPNTPGNLAGWIVNSQSVKPGNHMPPMDLNGDQVQALLAYLGSLK